MPACRSPTSSTCPSLGGRSGAAGQGGGAGGDRLRDQAGHRARSDPAGAGGRRAGGHRAGRCRLRRRVRLPGRGGCTRPALHAGHPLRNQRLAARAGATSSRSLVRPGTAADAPAPQPGPPADPGERPGPGPARQAWRKVTWRQGSQADLSSRFAALRVRPAHRDTLRSEPWPEEWLLIEWPKGAEEPTKYWFSNLPPADRPEGPGPYRQGPLADRTGLPGTEAGDRPRALRGPRLARLPSSCQPLHRSPRLPRRRALPFPPSGAPHTRADQGTCVTPGLPTARRPSGLSATCRTPSPPSGVASRSASSASSHAALAACSTTLASVKDI